MALLQLTLGCKRGVFFGRVDIQADKGIVDGDVLNMSLVPMLDVTGAGSRRCLQKSFDQFAAAHNRVPMLFREFGYHSPDVFWGSGEGRPQCFYRARARGWPIDEGDDRGIAPAIDHFLQADLEGTELAAAGIWIHHHRSSAGVDHRS